MSNTTTVIISEARGSDPTRRALEKNLASALAKRPEVELKILPHLYDLAPDGPGMRYLRSLPGDMIVFSWLYPRAAHWVLDANGVKGQMGRSCCSTEDQPEPAPTTPAQRTDDLLDRMIWCIDLRTDQGARPLLEEIEGIVAESRGKAPVSADRGEETAAGSEARLEESTRFRWYPVIDYSRCRNCLECLNFCLFGVFGLDDAEQIFVEQPDACRDGCPACSRVCPNRAIMFPQHSSPAIAGDPEARVDESGANLVQLLGATIAEQLAAAERDGALAEEAEPDQQAAKDELDRLVDDLDEMDL